MPYKYELFPRTGHPPEDVIVTFTEQAPESWVGYTRRIDSTIVSDVLQTYTTDLQVYVCGPATDGRVYNAKAGGIGCRPIKSLKPNALGPQYSLAISASLRGPSLVSKTILEGVRNKVRQAHHFRITDR